MLLKPFCDRVGAADKEDRPEDRTDQCCELHIEPDAFRSR